MTKGWVLVENPTLGKSGWCQVVPKKHPKAHKMRFQKKIYYILLDDLIKKLGYD